MMTGILLLVFSIALLVTWLATFGYWLGLCFLTRTPHKTGGDLSSQAGLELPQLTVVVPVLNEASYMEQKLADLQKTQYPEGRLRILVVDGGSTDDTIERSINFIPYRWPVEVYKITQDGGKSAQISAALRNITTELVVMTDVDTSLDPLCIEQLARELVDDERLGIVGARVVPVTSLKEETFHWKVINTLWSKEGLCFGTAGISGVCHAIKRAALHSVTKLYLNAEDIELSMLVTGAGYNARISDNAIAWEHRVPQSLQQMLRFRRRRIGDYKQALLINIPTLAPTGITRFVRWIRRTQMVVIPITLSSLIVTGFPLLVLGYWGIVAGSLIFFVISTLLWLRIFLNEPASSLLVCYKWAFVTLTGMLSARLNPQRDLDNKSHMNMVAATAPPFRSQ